ncbi:MAG TPA: hypothetical protein VHC22_22870 [Pirellulales bacterium]|nr:hypothetical protein [Pirellulales bacterium]
MKRRPLATKRTTSVSPSTNVNGTGPDAADPAEKTWQVDEASGVPAPVIRANSISFRLSHQGRVKVTFFGQE